MTFRRITLAALTIAVIIAMWPGYTAIALLFVFACIGIDLALTWAIRRWRK